MKKKIKRIVMHVVLLTIFTLYAVVIYKVKFPEVSLLNSLFTGLGIGSLAAIGAWGLVKFIEWVAE